ncbi:gas vesicle protein [Conexibacter arvalis]|uniref:Gas vesicle structural protein n=1 Tax=Conexibacter arvalis TaxID=912552 RepID=A0A840IE76_9ACTN|nr:gas vesicle protein [Conexibacter arvalis]MBB4662240.1 hypothetical protein [Conexibacter arvalis]
MSGIVPSSSGNAAAPGGALAGASEGASNLADVLERVLDKGIVIVGDIRVNLLDIELLTIRLRLLVAGVDTARRIGIDWWEHDPWLSGGDENRRAELEQRLDRIERLVAGEEEPPALERENEQLREEVDRLRRQLTSGSEQRGADG